MQDQAFQQCSGGQFDRLCNLIGGAILAQVICACAYDYHRRVCVCVYVLARAWLATSVVGLYEV